MDATTNETDSVETVENAAKPIREPEKSRGQRILVKACWRGKFGDVADVENAAYTPSVEQSILATSWLSEFSRTI